MLKHPFLFALQMVERTRLSRPKKEVYLAYSKWWWWWWNDAAATATMNVACQCLNNVAITLGPATEGVWPLTENAYSFIHSCSAILCSNYSTSVIMVSSSIIEKTIAFFHYFFNAFSSASKEHCIVIVITIIIIIIIIVARII